jgi:threonine synthase
VSDAEILEAQFLTGSLAGVFVEPAAATSVAAARKLRERGVIGRDELVVYNLTGHGLKQPEAVRIPVSELGVCPSNRKIGKFGGRKTIAELPIVDPGASCEVDFFQATLLGQAPSADRADACGIA